MEHLCDRSGYKEGENLRLHRPEPMSRLNNHLLPNPAHTHPTHGHSFPSKELLSDLFSLDKTKLAQINTDQMVNAMDKVRGPRSKGC